MKEVFISYSTVDAVQAETVRNVLEKNGLSCWMAPRDIPGGSNYTKEIPIAIRNCKVFVLILSKNAQSSHWVLKELDSAVNCGKVILPFMLEDCILNDEFNFLLTGAQRYAAYQKKAEAMETLIGRIRGILDAPGYTPSPEAAPVTEEAEESAPVPEKKPAKAAATYLGIAQCPSCAGTELEELTKKIGSFTLAEKLTGLLAPAMGVVGALVMVLLSSVLTSFIWTLYLYIDSLLLVLLPVGFAGGWFIGGRMAKERIRRQRVRKHIRQHPFRCVACRKEFLLEDK
jgi:hypothetical protein